MGELNRLRALPENSYCADCASRDNSWASVTHGVFLCIVCSDVHRAVGTHITKMKGCTGTYLWGPDELEKMQPVGNRKGDELYGSDKISPDASKAEKQKFVEAKYKHREARSATAQPQALTRPVQPQVPAIEIAGRTPSMATAGPQFVPRSSALARPTSVPDSVFDDLFGDMDLSPAVSCKHAAPPLFV